MSPYGKSEEGCSMSYDQVNQLANLETDASNGTEGLWDLIREGHGKTKEGQDKFVIHEGKRMWNSSTMRNLETRHPSTE
jgi:hypothetical protein